MALGRAGTIGTIGAACLGAGFGATGVASPGAEAYCSCDDDGVVGFVELLSSDAGKLVVGVSGRTRVVSAEDGTLGSNTGSSICTATSSSCT